MSKYPTDAPPEALDEIARIQSGELPGYAAKHPMARQWAADQAAQGIQFTPPHVQADPNRVAAAQAAIGNGTISTPALISPDIAIRTAQAQKQLSMQPRSGETQEQFTQRITSDPNLTAVDVEQAGAQPFKAPYDSQLTGSGHIKPEEIRAIYERSAIEDARMKRQQFLDAHGKSTVNGKAAPNQSNQYVNPGSRGIVPQTHTTQAQIEQALSTPVKLTAYGSGPEHLFGPGPTPTDDHGNPLPEGQVFETGGMTFRNDARAGQATPVVFDAVKKDWVPRDAFLERKAQHDPNFNVKYRKAQSDLQSVVKSEALEPGTQFGDAMKQAQGALFDLAKNATAVPEPQTLAEDFATNSAPAPDGSVWYRGPDGKPVQISKPHHERAITPKEVADLRKTAQAMADAAVPTKKDAAGAEVAARPATAQEVQKYMDQLVEDYLTTADKITAARARAGGATGAPAQGAAQSSSSGPSQEDLEHTAKLHGLTVDEVKKKLGIQ